MIKKSKKTIGTSIPDDKMLKIFGINKENNVRRESNNKWHLDCISRDIREGKRAPNGRPITEPGIDDLDEIKSIEINKNIDDFIKVFFAKVHWAKHLLRKIKVNSHDFREVIGEFFLYTPVADYYLKPDEFIYLHAEIFETNWTLFIYLNKLYPELEDDHTKRSPIERAIEIDECLVWVYYHHFLSDPNR